MSHHRGRRCNFAAAHLRPAPRLLQVGPLHLLAQPGHDQVDALAGLQRVAQDGGGQHVGVAEGPLRQGEAEGAPAAAAPRLPEGQPAKGSARRRGKGGGGERDGAGGVVRESLPGSSTPASSAAWPHSRVSGSSSARATPLCSAPAGSPTPASTSIRARPRSWQTAGCGWWASTTSRWSARRGRLSPCTRPSSPPAWRCWRRSTSATSRRGPTSWWPCRCGCAAGTQPRPGRAPAPLREPRAPLPRRSALPTPGECREESPPGARRARRDDDPTSMTCTTPLGGGRHGGTAVGDLRAALPRGAPGPR